MINKSNCLLARWSIVIFLLTGISCSLLPTFSKGEAVPAISAFAGEPDLRVEKGEVQAMAFGQQAQVYEGNIRNGDKVRFEMDTKTGEVVGFFRFNQTGEEVKVDQSTAQTNALAFVKQHYPNFKNLNPILERAELIKQGNLASYFFLWVRIDPASGAYLPDMVSIRVNASTGQVDSYLSRQVAVTISTTPATSKNQALEIAQTQSAAIPDAKVISSNLMVATLPLNEPDGEQALLWYIVIQGAPDAQDIVPGCIIIIDAQTGEVISVDPFE
jgi:hypothetical protein